MSDSATKSSNRGHRAGIFDIRNIIGALLGIDGLIILLVGIFGDAEEDKTGGVNANLWAARPGRDECDLPGWAWLRPWSSPTTSRKTTMTRADPRALASCVRVMTV
jgi:hypothetical protein